MAERSAEGRSDGRLTILIKGVTDEDFVNYKKPSMFIAFPKCTFKCEKDCGVVCCQNGELAKAENIRTNTEDIAIRYLSNPITKALVFGGLEPFDSFFDMTCLISELRFIRRCDDDIVIYTGYTEDEISEEIKYLKYFKNIIVKFGRYVPGKEGHFDDVIGIELRSPNQYAKKIS